MRILVILSVVAVLSAGAFQANAQVDPGLERRQALAERYVDLAVGDNLRRSFEGYVETVTKSGGPEFAEERIWMRQNLPDMTLQMIDELLTTMAPIYAERLTEAELSALVDFYDSPIGREIARKIVQLSLDTRPMIDEATAAYTERFQSAFCARFDCVEDDQPKRSD